MVSAQLLQLGHRPTLPRWCAEANPAHVTSEYLRLLNRLDKIPVRLPGIEEALIGAGADRSG